MACDVRRRYNLNNKDQEYDQRKHKYGRNGGASVFE